MPAPEPDPRPRRPSVAAALGRAARPAFWLTVVLFGAFGVQQGLSADLPAAERAAVVALGGVILAACVACRRYPLASLLAVEVAALLTVLVDPGSPQGTPLALLLVSYALGRRAESIRELQLGLGAAAALLALVDVIDRFPESVGTTTTSIGMLLLAPAALGRGVRDRDRLREATQLRAAQEEAGRMERAAQALLDERARIAGELHDVVAHALSAMVVQAGGARVLGHADPAAAAQAFGAVERTGRDALFEIRGLVGVLREEDDQEADREPQPSLEHLGSLVARVRRDGLPTSLAVEGEERPLPAGISLAGYRAVQDALRAARDEGEAGRAEVRLRYEPAALLLTVEDDGPGSRGPLAVRERVTLYGGELSDAPVASGHRVTVRLPVERAA